MCGLVAYAGEALKLLDFEKHFKSLVHRGPDDSEILSIGSEATICFQNLHLLLW